LDLNPTSRSAACQYDSCTPNSGTTGHNATSPRLNWVNSFPVTGVRFGIDTFGPQFWDGQPPELVVTGPNVGSNLFVQVPFSGTVGGAVFAAHERGIPSIAFSGLTGGNLPWNTSPAPLRSSLYAELATQLTNAILASGTPYLPDDVFLNVNFPAVEGDCTSASKFKWVLSRINVGLLSAPDVNHCSSTRLPLENEVVDNDSGCFISVSVGDAADKTTADAERQAVVLQKLGDMIICLP